MARRSDFTQKLLDDLRVRKERMGLLPPGQQRSSSSSSGSLTVAGYKNSRWSFYGSGEAAVNPNSNRKNVSAMETAANMWLGSRNRAPLIGGSQEIVPYGRRHTIDLSMALSMALSNSGKLQNIEILGNPTMGRKIVLHMEGNRAPSQIGEVAKGVQNLNMILKACSNGFNFSRDSVDIGRELLKGAMDLEESLKMLMTLQDASDYMVGSRKKKQVKLLKGKEEEEEELQTHQRNRRKPGRNTKFSFIKPGAAAASNGSHELVRFSSNGASSISEYNLNENAVSEKVRIPNIIAKLMGLEELPAPTERKRMSTTKLVEIDEDINNKESNVIANSMRKMVKIDGQEKGVNNIAKNSLRSTRNPENISPASKDSTKMYSRNNGEMDDKIAHKSETRVKKDGVPQEEITITKQKMKARIEHTISAVGDSLTDHTNETRVRKKDAAVGREEKTARKQPTMDKIVQIDSSVKIINSNHEQKTSLGISEAKHGNAGKKELIQKTAGFNQTHNERNSESVQLQIHRSQSGEGIKETSSEKKPDTKGKLQSSIANKRVMKSKDIEKHLNEMRERMQSSKVSVNSNKNDLVNKIGSQSKKENLRIIPDGTNIRNKSTHNHHREKILIEKSTDKRLTLKSNTRAEKMARTSMQATVMMKPTQVQSLQKLNKLKVREGDTNRGNSMEVTVQNKCLDASQAMEQRNSILEELEYRWKERNKKAEGIDKGSDANQELNMQQKIEIISSVNLPEDNSTMEMTTCNPISREDTTSTCSSPLTRDVNIQASMDQPIQEDINVKSEKENSVYQLPERSGITMIECLDKGSQEDSTQKYKETQSSFTENKEEDHSEIMQLNSSKSIVYEDQTIMDVDQQEVLTKDEDALKQMLITSQNFLNVAQSLFQIKIPVDILQANENANPDRDSKLVIDCGYELLRRKSKREELSFSSKGSFAPLKRRSIDILIKEVNADLESLKYQNYAGGCDYDLAACLHKMIEKDVQHWHPDINCLWDFSWDGDTFVCLEKDEIARDVEKHVLNGLLNELSRDLLNVSENS